MIWCQTGDSVTNEALLLCFKTQRGVVMMTGPRRIYPNESARKWFSLLGTVIGYETLDTRGQITKYLARKFPHITVFGPKNNHFILVKLDETMYNQADSIGLTRYPRFNNNNEGYIRNECKFFVTEKEQDNDYPIGALVGVSFGTINSADQFYTGAKALCFNLKVLAKKEDLETLENPIPLLHQKEVSLIEKTLSLLKEKEQKRVVKQHSLAGEVIVFTEQVVKLFDEPYIISVRELLRLTNERVRIGAYRDGTRTLWTVFFSGEGFLEIEDSGLIPWRDGSSAGTLSRLPIERSLNIDVFASRAVRKPFGDVEKIRTIILDRGFEIARGYTKR